MTRPTITAKQFDDVAAHCGRWAEKSLSIARELIVDGAQLSDVAARHDCTPAYANIVRARFYDKAQNVWAESFKQQVNPDTMAALKPHRRGLEKLAADGIKPPQLVEYLKQHNVSVSTATVRKFLSGAES